MNGSFWTLVGLMTLVVVVLVARPLFTRRSAGADRVDYDLNVYRDQLKELDRDLKRGVLSPEEEASARREIERRMLKADSRSSAEQAAETDGALFGPLGAVMMAVIVALPLGGVGLYAYLGQPDLKSAPLAERTAEISDSQEMSRLAANLRARLEQNPDPRGWELLGRTYINLGELDNAVSAFQQAVTLAPEVPGLYAVLGEAQIRAEGGMISREALINLETALELDPQEPRALFYIALEKAQTGATEEALNGFVKLARITPINAGWRDAVLAQVVGLASELGLDPESLDTNPRVPPMQDAPELPSAQAAGPPAAGNAGPTAEQMQAAQEMSPQEQQAMIQSMVERLAEKMEKNPEDLDGWLRLARAQMVLNNRDGMIDALRRAKPLIRDLPKTDPRRQMVEQALQANGE